MSAIFMSHASKDDAFVKELRMALEGHGLPAWVDSRELRGGAKLAPEIAQAIEHARPGAGRRPGAGVRRSGGGGVAVGAVGGLNEEERNGGRSGM